ncbi:IclR family transcriptional regulator C-terminal domain-containing protein [Saliphagus sp. GCM10025334]
MEVETIRHEEDGCEYSFTGPSLSESFRTTPRPAGSLECTDRHEEGTSGATDGRRDSERRPSVRNASDHEDTITDIDEFLEGTAKTRVQRYGMEDEGRVSGIESVIVPITGNDHDSENLAIAIASPNHHFGAKRIEIESLVGLQNAVNAVELQSRHYQTPTHVITNVTL